MVKRVVVGIVLLSIAFSIFDTGFPTSLRLALDVMQLVLLLVILERNTQNEKPTP